MTYYFFRTKRWTAIAYLSFQKFRRWWSQVRDDEFTQTLILLRKSYCLLTRLCNRWSVGARGLQEGSLPTDWSRSMVLFVGNNAWFYLLLKDRKNRRRALGHLSSDDQGQIMRDVVLFMVIPNWMYVQKNKLEARMFGHVLCSTVRERKASISPPVSLRYALSGGFNNRCILKARVRLYQQVEAGCLT